jgi:hypothetical protein
MQYVTCRSHPTQKQSFGVTCPGALFVISVPVLPEHEKECVDIVAFLKPNRIFRKCTDANCSSFHL